MRRELIEALTYPRLLILKIIDPTACTCEACTWIRDSQRLIDTFESSLPPNPHRPAH